MKEDFINDGLIQINIVMELADLLSLTDTELFNEWIKSRGSLYVKLDLRKYGAKIVFRRIHKILRQIGALDELRTNNKECKQED